MTRQIPTWIAPTLVALPLLLSGCASYTTPARGVSMDSLAAADGDIRERMLRKPAAEFPAHIVLAHVQESGYRSYRHDGYGSGRFSVVTGRDVEQQETLRRLEGLPMVAAIGPLNRLVLPPNLRSDKDLRLAGASLKADMLLAYTFDTIYRIDGTDIGPLGLITLGFLPVDEAVVTSTASAALFDVRTGYVYGLAEATARETRLASAWSSRDAADRARVEAESKAFADLMTQIEAMWKQVVEQYAAAKPDAAHP